MMRRLKRMKRTAVLAKDDDLIYLSIGTEDRIQKLNRDRIEEVGDRNQENRLGHFVLLLAADRLAIRVLKVHAATVKLRRRSLVVCEQIGCRLWRLELDEGLWLRVEKEDLYHTTEWGTQRRQVLLRRVERQIANMENPPRGFGDRLRRRSKINERYVNDNAHLGSGWVCRGTAVSVRYDFMRAHARS